MNPQETVRPEGNHVRPASSPAVAETSDVLNMVFRYRYWIHGLIYGLAFLLSWAVPGRKAERVWLVLPELISRYLAVGLQSAIIGVTAGAVLLALAGAWLRTWGTAYLGAGVVSDPKLRGQGISSSGPYRYVRNPLYLGTILHTLALCLLMSWVGAAFAVLAITLLQVLLIRSEERFLSTTLGAAYRVYVQKVPRIVPRLTPVAAEKGSRGLWLQAALSEIYMWGTAVSLAVLGWQYNAVLVLQGILVSLGLSILVRGFRPRERR